MENARGRYAWPRCVRADLGEEAITRFEGNMDALLPDFRKLVMEFVAGDLYDRGGIDAKTRSLITCLVVGALGRNRQLAEHIEGALKNGATEEEVTETLLHLCAYAGFPAAWHSLEVARRVFSTRHRRRGNR